MDYLAHHGIPNQKWGERNGPPYPLSREEHENVVKSGDIKKLRENITEFKDWEIEQALKRFDYNQRISGLIDKPEVSKGEKFVRKYTKAMDTAGNVLSTTVRTSEYAVRMYNIIARTLNSLKGTSYKIIDSGNKDKDKNRDSNNDHDNNRNEKQHLNEKRNNSLFDKMKKRRQEKKEMSDRIYEDKQQKKNDARREIMVEKAKYRLEEKHQREMDRIADQRYERNKKKADKYNWQNSKKRRR